MNNIYIYKNNFIDLLNLISFLINNNITPNNIRDEKYSPILFDNIINLDLEIKNNILKKNLITKILFDIYLSNEDNKELIIYYFYKNYLKYGMNILNMYKLKCVDKGLKIRKYVRNEIHKYKGFTRFKELNNKVLYAEIEPINNILIILSSHFKKRLRNEYWIIKDVGRNIFSIYNKMNFYIFNEDNFTFNMDYSSNEETYQELWKSFYNTIGIKDRKNDRCRMNFMPKRYWKYLIEMSDEL